MFETLLLMHFLSSTGDPNIDRCVTAVCEQGKGEGQLHMKITYFPFELLYSVPRDASLVRLLSKLSSIENSKFAE